MIIKTVQVRADVFNIDKQVVNLRDQPNTSGGIIAKAQVGQQYTVVESANERWTKVLTHQKDTAYIYSSLGHVESIIIQRIPQRRFHGREWLQGFLFILMLLGMISWCIYLNKLDKKRKTIELYYAMETELEEMYNKFLTYFKEFTTSRKVWQKLHSQRALDTKYTGGASNLVSRMRVTQIEFDSKPTTFIKTNVAIPHIRLKNTDMFFFPERLVLKRNRKFASIFYKNLQVDQYSIRFIEDEGVPKDANIVDYTWKYVNRSGGPDKRFRDNRRLPICNYSEYHFKSEGGINEIINTSKYGAMDNFVNFINQIGTLQARSN